LVPQRCGPTNFSFMERGNRERTNFWLSLHCSFVSRGFFAEACGAPTGHESAGFFPSAFCLWTKDLLGLARFLFWLRVRKVLRRSNRWFFSVWVHGLSEFGWEHFPLLCSRPSFGDNFLIDRCHFVFFRDFQCGLPAFSSWKSWGWWGLLAHFLFPS